jgi:membrane protein YdbS with pleckstrin-like domain
VAKAKFDFPTRPDPRIRFVWSLRGLPMAFIASLPLTFFTFPFLMVGQFLDGSVGPDPFSLFRAGFSIWVTVFLVLLALQVVYAFLAAKMYSFQVGEEEVTVRKGVVFRTTSRIPLRRVQDIHVRQGPLLRAFGLGSIKLETAGFSGPNRYGQVGLHSEGQLPGVANAEEIAEAIMERVKGLRGDV